MSEQSQAAPASPCSVHPLFSTPQLYMNQPGNFRRVASNFLSYPLADTLTTEQISESLRCPIRVAQAMVSCASLFRTLEWPSDRVRVAVPSQDGPDRLRFPYLPTAWRSDWLSGRVGRFSFPLSWIEEEALGRGFDYGVLVRFCDGARVHERAGREPVYVNCGPTRTSTILRDYGHPPLTHKITFVPGSSQAHLGVQ